MPEQITKYPDVTQKVLEGSGARCGEGVQQRILTECPPGNFCSLPKGELCIYSIEEIPQMTQISESEIAQVVCPSETEASMIPDFYTGSEPLLLGVFIAGVLLGLLINKLRRVIN